MLVMAGKPVDATIDLLMEFLEDGDCIIDGGNEWCAACQSSTDKQARVHHLALSCIKSYFSI